MMLPDLDNLNLELIFLLSVSYYHKP